MDDNKGTSLVFVHTEKGCSLLLGLQKYLLCKEQPVSKELSIKNYPIDEWRPRSDRRNHFFRLYRFCTFKMSEYAIYNDAFYKRLWRKVKRICIFK